MMEWRVIESRLLARQIHRAPREIQRKYMAWRNLVQHSGPHLGGGFRVHALQGSRKGQKSAWLNRQWRVIFKMVEDQLIVEALEVTPHRY
jgi:mRNA-degrading endonuclease YafQ of YafQ-DinJ toxin-antitoxin module